MKEKLLPSKQYKELLKISPICTVDVLFFNKNFTKILLFKRNNEPLKGVYFSIGGRLLKNERFLDGAVRQAMREAKIKIIKNKLIWSGAQEELYPNSVFDKIPYHAVAIFYSYLVDENKFKPKMDNQHSEYKWFLVKDKKITPNIKKRIVMILKTYEKKF
ncbi:NUDIX domain-containing protein [Patescibacteria group bacterium]|nr:NUDIX domain-containing protein [Patescibacteria group bacterium]